MADLVKQLHIKPTYIKDNGVFVYDIEKVVLPNNFIIKQKALIAVPAGKIAGNHKHPRSEAFISFSSDLVLIWLDETGEKHETAMRNESEMYLFILQPNIPHAVINKGTNEAVMFEFADAIQHDVTQLEIV